MSKNYLKLWQQSDFKHYIFDCKYTEKGSQVDNYKIDESLSNSDRDESYLV